MKPWTESINYFISYSNRKSLIAQRKASILVFAHFFFLFGSGLTTLFSFLFDEKIEWWLAFVPAFVLASLFYFKKNGSTAVSGCILAAICYVIITPTLLNTGGIYSCFVPWLFIIPLTTALVEELEWSSGGLLIVFITYIGVFFYGRNHPEIVAIRSNDVYYLFNYLFVGFYIFCLLIVFEGAQLFTIKILKNKNQLLREQKKIIAQHADELEDIERKLTESNIELQNFAFAASHDLKEPLRMIGMYTQLVQKRMKEPDENIKEYMFFITDGVKRMQRLLEDLLTYSRLGKNSSDTKELDLDSILLKVLNNLTVAINETNTLFKHSKLPQLKASETEMIQLFQNLINNSIKFRKLDVRPEIVLQYTEETDDHVFSLSDNGIGIKKDHFGQIFNIFTRLHSQAIYEGTGIGLATCKKIVNNLGGRIWLESAEGYGTTFYFTIPKSHAIEKKSADRLIPEKEFVAA